MAYDTDLDPILQAIRDSVTALAARVERLEHATVPEEPADPPPPVEPPPPPLPAVVSLNRKLIGLAIPDGEIMSGTAAKITRINSLGIKAVRMDLRYETVRDFGLDHYDATIRALRLAGIHVLAILGGNLKVATLADAQAFAAHVSQAVAWLRARDVHHIQFWNEPNHASRITTPENYTRAIKLAYPAAKAANPAVFCVGAGLSNIPSSVNGHISAADWLTRCYAAGAKGSYDALAGHPYSYPYPLSHPVDWTGWGVMVRVMRPIMEANGEGALKFWITEVGFPTTGEEDFSEADQQTEFAQQLVAEMNRHAWIGPAFIYSLQDRSGAETDPENVFGLYRTDGTRKPAATTITGAVAAFPAVA